MIRELAKKLAAFKDFVDCVIISAEFKRGTFEESAEILKTHAAMILIRVRSSEAELLIKMIRPRKEIQATFGSRIQTAEKIWRVFTASEVSEFTAAVGDQNKIHQFNPPIVPGLLILETICATFPTKSFKVKFKNFITAGEPLSLQVVENKFEITSAGVKKVSGEFL